jgi:hypothetical protein
MQAPNQAMKPMAPDRVKASNLATDIKRNDALDDAV